MKKNLFVRLSLALLLSFAAGRAGATGYSGPQFYLDRGGANIAASPEFYWELEVRRLALDFHPPEKYLPSSDIAAVEATDFRAALAKGRIKPADPAAATRQHDESRAVIARTNATSTEPLPAEFPSEFADYHRGAFAYCRGPEHYEEARQAWEELLRRPEDERHYRSTWAAFMLGKLALKQNNPVAVEWFQRTRALAGAGFTDSLGMAADSYGWEGRSEWKQDHPEKAAPLFLTQLALGDESAVVSLKVVIPDRKPTEGMLNYDPAPGENVVAKLEQAARDPLLRRLITAHILATESVPSEFRYGEDEEANKRSGRWLKMLQALKLTQVTDAEYIGWAAYNDGDYTGATHWLELAQKKTPAALWLRAKLQRRAGKITEAAKTMAEAVENLRDSPAYSFVNAKLGPEWEYFDPHWTLPKSAAGDLGLLRLERSEFLRAFEALFQADLWSDAAFVAERILTTGELKSYVDEHAVASGAATEERGKKLRYLLGRRLVRDDRYESAAAYLPSPYDQVLAKYAAALRAGHDSARTKMERARSLFTAAWLARNEGMELMGTEVAPDNFQEGGNFEASEIAEQIQSGTYQTTSYPQNGAPEIETKKIALRLPPRGHSRLMKTKTEPDLRFHYRYLASALALRAASLLPNDSDELADVVNRAGLWIKDRDEKLGNRYYQVLERRAANTTLGRSALARHWFVEESGPWSEAEAAALEAMRKELNFLRPP